jgi:hypothetical protein
MHLQELIINLVAMRVVDITTSYLVSQELVSSIYTPANLLFDPSGYEWNIFLS